MIRQLRSFLNRVTEPCPKASGLTWLQTNGGWGAKLLEIQLGAVLKLLWGSLTPTLNKYLRLNAHSLLLMGGAPSLLSTCHQLQMERGHWPGIGRPEFCLRRELAM